MQRRDLGVAVSVMDMAVISGVLAFAELCCLLLGSVRPVLLSSHILLHAAVARSHFFNHTHVCTPMCLCVCVLEREIKHAFLSVYNNVLLV